MEQLDFFRIKNFCPVKNPVQRMKRQIRDGEKILAKHVSDKGLIFRMRK